MTATSKRRRLSPLTLLLLAFCSAACQGPDPMRVRAERDSFTLAQRCADGWFQALPATAHDRELVQKSLVDWDRRLKADEQLIAAPIGGAK